MSAFFVQETGENAVFITDGITMRWVQTPQVLADLRTALGITAPVKVIAPGNLYAYGVLIGTDPDELPA